MTRLIALATLLAVVTPAEAGGRLFRRAAGITTGCRCEAATTATTASETQPVATADDVPFDASGFLAEVNRVRAENGAASLGWSDQRADYSQRHANIVARTNRAFHPGRYPIGSGEIMARGQQSLAEACGDWLNSPGHRALLLGDFRSVGVARSGDVWFAQFE